MRCIIVIQESLHTNVVSIMQMLDQFACKQRAHGHSAEILMLN
jgi:hypothetical protein